MSSHSYLRKYLDNLIASGAVIEGKPSDEPV